MDNSGNLLKREKKFHDQWASTIKVDGIDVNIFFEGSTAPENRFILSQLGNLKGKYLLDVGCGAGESSVYFASKGAKCIAGDFSPSMVETAENLANKYGVEIEGKVINAMEIDFDDNTFDIVYAANILHHVDPSIALREIHRVLKPGGLACMWDPLKHNPLIKVYRIIATNVRTVDEHPLDIKFVDEVEKIFSEVNYDTFWLATLWIFLRFFLIERVSPNKERYWKKIYYDEPKLRLIYSRLEEIDHILKKFQILKRFAWNIAIVAKK